MTRVELSFCLCLFVWPALFQALRNTSGCLQNLHHCATVTLLLNTGKMGLFSSYLVVENKQNVADLKLIRVEMEVCKQGTQDVTAFSMIFWCLLFSRLFLLEMFHELIHFSRWKSMALLDLSRLLLLVRRALTATTIATKLNQRCFPLVMFSSVNFIVIAPSSFGTYLQFLLSFW